MAQTLHADLSMSLDGGEPVVVSVAITYSYYAGRRPNDERAGYPDTGADPEVTILGIQAQPQSGVDIPIIGPVRGLLEPLAKKAVLAYNG